MPAPETTQPQSQQMPSVENAARISSEQPRPVENMTPEPVSMRGGGEGGDICCAAPVSPASNVSSAVARRIDDDDTIPRGGSGPHFAEGNGLSFYTLPFTS
ncbi:hypothetical protein B7463_g9437, partial [Scytalidium lignicola]